MKTEELTKLAGWEEAPQRSVGEAVFESQNTQAGWHALYTRHQHEKAAANLLGQKGYEVFLPLRLVAHRWKDRVQKISLPLFPCYVFLRGGLDRRVELLSTPGVHSLVCLGAEVAVIPEKEIAAVRQVVESRASAEPCPFLKCGERVRIHTGPLAGIEGILVRQKDAYRIILSVEFLHRSIAVELDRLAVERLPCSRAEANGCVTRPAAAFA